MISLDVHGHEILIIKLGVDDLEQIDKFRYLGSTATALHICMLKRFHLKCLRRILKISWLGHLRNTEVLRRVNADGIEAYIMRWLLEWSGNLTQMQKNEWLSASSTQYSRRASVSMVNNYTSLQMYWSATLNRCEITRLPRGQKGGLWLKPVFNLELKQRSELNT